MPEDFRGPWLKLNRANDHIIELYPLMERFLKNQAYVAVPDLQIEPGYVVWITRGKEPFPHDEFAPFIGDVIHNLRDSLDLAISVLMRNAGEFDVGVYFPSGASIGHFQKSVGKGPKRAKSAKPPPNFPAKVLDILETRIEPYKSGHGELLRVLHNLAITDKHRILVPMVLGVQVVALPLPIHLQMGGHRTFPLMIQGVPIPIKDGCELMRQKVTAFPANNMKLDQNASVTLAIAFDERAGALNAVDVVDGCRRLFNATEDALQALEECVSGVTQYFAPLHLPSSP